jgi:hypothetical protein
MGARTRVPIDVQSRASLQRAPRRAAHPQAARHFLAC